MMAAIMRYCLLASGSKGNACLLESRRTRLLIDIGIGPRVLKWRLAPLNLCPTDVEHLLLTHEHTDHLCGLEALLKRQPDLKIHATAGTISALPLKARRQAVPIRPGRTFTVGDVSIHTFATSHDAAQSVGFRLEAHGAHLGYATDLGCFSTATVRHLSGCHGLVVEANHCPHMLKDGPYPGFLKARIGSKQGHLSNVQTRKLLSAIAHSGLRHLTLAHLSETNNTPQTALGVISALFGKDNGPMCDVGQRRTARPPVEIEDPTPKQKRKHPTQLELEI
jgi:phosphoribosyl 1,2-cyclic phosphodiesterase